ncbi:MAG TPA: zf-HC2 domain-containing protein [Vicinamibacterales bacterium]|jgi:anti-sigma factor RsiW
MTEDYEACRQLDPIVTPYVDGELPAADHARVDEHVRVCGPCRSRVAAERSVRELIQARKSALFNERASADLRERCAGAMRGARRATSTGEASRWPAWRARLAPLALAATLILLVSGAFVYQLTDRSSRVMAAELTADHLKCFAVNDVLGTHDAPMTVQAAMTSHFGWTLQLPQNPQRAGLELVGARPCLYGEGRVAHLMYRHHGVPVSVFMLPASVRPQELLDVMGHEAAIWSVGQRTFVLIAREPRQDVERLAEFVQASLR